MSKSGLPAVMMFVIAAAFLCAPVKQAHAIATVEVNVTGQSLGETTLQLTDEQGQAVKEDDDSDKAAGFWRWRNKRPGTYRLQVLRNGVPVGAPQTIQVIDNKTNTFRADSQGGQVTTISSAFAPDVMRQYAVGVYGGWKHTPWDGTISSTVANTTPASGDLDDNFGMIGFEGRYYLSPVQQRMQALGAGLFITGTYIHYMTGGLDRLFGSHHIPVPGDDVGVGVDERWSFLLGLGKEFNLYQRLGIALMVGAHMTRADITALADEGQGERYRQSRTLFGPFIGAELFYRIGAFYSLPVVLALQTRMMWMPDTTLSANSNNFAYHAEVDGGPNVNVMAGLRVAF